MALQNLLLQKLVNRELFPLIAVYWQVGRQADKHGAAEPSGLHGPPAQPRPFLILSGKQSQQEHGTL